MKFKSSIFPGCHLLLAAGLLTYFLVGGLTSSASPATIYVSQSGAGAQNGTSVGNAYPMTFLTAIGNWGAGIGQVGPGVTVMLEGQITTQFSILASGASGNPITIKFDTGAYMSSPCWAGATFAIGADAKNYIVIDGGGTNNGAIFCSANGIGLANQASATGIACWDCSYFTVQNLAITNMYVFSGNTYNGSGAGMGINFTELSSPSTACTVSNCLFHDENTGVQFTYAAGWTGMSMVNCTAYNCNWGGGAGDSAGASLSGLTISGNHFYNWQVWDDSADTYHHNGFYAYAVNSGSSLTGVVVSGNVVGPGFSTAGHSTSGIFISGNVTSLIYNNVFLATDGTAPANALLVLGGYGGGQALNNSFIGGQNGVGLQMSEGTGQSSTAYYVTNNIFLNLSAYIAEYSYGNYSYSGGYNLFYGSQSTSPFIASPNGSGVFLSFGAWTTYNDAHFLTGNPLLNGSYIPQPGSAAVGAGVNLTSLGIAGLIVDANGNLRSSGTNAWTIGAFGLAGSLGVEIFPTNAVAAGAQWQVDGGTYETNGAILANISVGQHVVSFKPIAGWMTPGSQSVLITTNSVTTASGIYTNVPGTGGLQVTILPSSLLAGGAQWQTNGGPFLPSGTVLNPVPAGSYIVNFNNNVTNCTPPPSEVVTVTNGQFTQVTNYYSTYGLHVILPPTNVLNGLVLWLTCDAAANGAALDLSGNGNTGILSGQTLPVWTTGEITNALSFDGMSGYIDCGNATGLGITSNITLAAWVNVAGFPASSAIETIIGKGYDGNNEGYFLRLRGNSGTPVVDAGSYATIGNVNYVVTWTVSGWSTGTWHYLAATYDGSKWNLYFDGTLQASTFQPQGALTSGEHLTVGAEFDPSIGRYFQGAIDDVRIYNRALSAGEIANQYRWPAVSGP